MSTNQTKVFTPVSLEQVINYLKQNLTIDVKTTEELDTWSGDYKFKTSHEIELILDQEVISRVYL